MDAYGDYRILRVLGQGGMGVVYEAEHGALGRRVALKVLVEQALRDPVALARLRREALAMGALQHPHVVQVSDFSEGPPPFLVMELLAGQSLRDRLRDRGPIRPEDACVIAVQLLSALGAAHRAGIVHRDVKPANVFVVQTPLTSVFVKLLDFGIAKLLTPQAGPALTSFDDVVGSAPYMAPEQIRGEEIDARTDIFAVGVTLYEMLAGRRPFVAAANENVMVSILRGGPIAPLAVPRALEAIVLRAITRAASARYLTADEMAAALLTFISQASLGAVATLALESRTALGGTLAEQATATGTSTRTDSSTRGAPPTVGPPTYSPPTLANTLDHTARADHGQPPFSPSPMAPTWSAPPATSPPYHGREGKLSGFGWPSAARAGLTEGVLCEIALALEPATGVAGRQSATSKSTVESARAT